MTRAGPIDVVRERVLRHGRFAAAYQLLNRGYRYWLDDATDSAAGYVRRGDWWVVGGGPVCPAGQEAAVAGRLERAAAAAGCRVVYVCADATLRDALNAAGGYDALAIGAEPVWDPRHWWQRPAASASLRQQLNRARRKGVTIERWTPERLRSGRPELDDVVADWLTTRALPAMSFLNDPHPLRGVLTDRRLWAARQHGRVIGFVLASPVPARGGYLLEQVARRRRAPNGTAELLIDGVLRDLARWRCRYATLGLVMLSDRAAGPMGGNPAWARLLFAFARAHGRRFYNYDGLARFREKLRPDAWEPIHLITRRRPFPFAALHAAGAAFCGGQSPFGFVSAGVGKALTTEIGRGRRWLWPAAVAIPAAPAPTAGR